MGIFRQVSNPTYDDVMASQLAKAKEDRGEGILEALLTSGDTWDAPERRKDADPVYQGPDRRDST
jgi:hypothetical protein